MVITTESLEHDLNGRLAQPLFHRFLLILHAIAIPTTEGGLYLLRSILMVVHLLRIHFTLFSTLLLFRSRQGNIRCCFVLKTSEAVYTQCFCWDGGRWARRMGMLLMGQSHAVAVVVLCLDSTRFVNEFVASTRTRYATSTRILSICTIPSEAGRGFTTPLHDGIRTHTRIIGHLARRVQWGRTTIGIRIDIGICMSIHIHIPIHINIANPTIVTPASNVSIVQGRPSLKVLGCIWSITMDIVISPVALLLVIGSMYWLLQVSWIHRRQHSRL